MIEARALHRWAADTIAAGSSSECELRRAVSGLYYGLFHRVAEIGAEAFGQVAAALRVRLLRAYDHRAVKKVCFEYERWVSTGGSSRVDVFHDVGLDPHLALLSRAITTLQEARHHADYDLTREFGRAYAQELLELAEAGWWKLDELNGSERLRLFVAIVLLEDKLRSRG